MHSTYLLRKIQSNPTHANHTLAFSTTEYPIPAKRRELVNRFRIFKLDIFIPLFHFLHSNILTSWAIILFYLTQSQSQSLLPSWFPIQDSSPSNLVPPFQIKYIRTRFAIGSRITLQGPKTCWNPSLITLQSSIANQLFSFCFKRLWNSAPVQIGICFVRKNPSFLLLQVRSFSLRKLRIRHILIFI